MCQKSKSEHNIINKHITWHDTYNLFNKYLFYPIIIHLTRLLKFNTIMHKINLISTCKHV